MFQNLKCLQPKVGLKILNSSKIWNTTSWSRFEDEIPHKVGSEPLNCFKSHVAPKSMFLKFEMSPHK